MQVKTTAIEATFLYTVTDVLLNVFSFAFQYI